MKRVQAPSRSQAFNLIELLAILAIVGLIAATFLHKKTVPPEPQRERGRDGVFSGRCANNQRMIAEAFLKAANDRGDQFLWAPTANAKEPVGNGHVADQYRAISNYFSGDMTVLLCPSDRMRGAARDFATLDDTNVSYFMDVDASKGSNAANIILVGDRHLEVGTNAVSPGLFVYTTGMEMGWTTELHSRMRTNGMDMRWRTRTNMNFPAGPMGTMAFADGHADRFPMATTNLSAVFAKQNLDRARLLVP